VAVLLGLAGRDFVSVTWAAVGWLALLALTSQVIGWLLITVSMPRLPAAMIGALLLVQPAGSVALSYVILGERPSGSQLLGVALVLAGVLVAVTPTPGRSGAAEHEDHAPRLRRVDGQIGLEVPVAGHDGKPAR
jgi:drug/metabolite transporter (DMT)-like permease